MSPWSSNDGFTGCQPPFGSAANTAGCWHLATTECVCPCHITEAVTVRLSWTTRIVNEAAFSRTGETMKTETAFLVRVKGGLFSDVVVSTKTTVEGAVRDGLRWYRQVAAKPHMVPDISVERVQRVV